MFLLGDNIYVRIVRVQSEKDGVNRVCRRLLPLSEAFLTKCCIEEKKMQLSFLCKVCDTLNKRRSITSSPNDELCIKFALHKQCTVLLYEMHPVALKRYSQVPHVTFSLVFSLNLFSMYIHVLINFTDGRLWLPSARVPTTKTIAFHAHMSKPEKSPSTCHISSFDKDVKT